MCRTCFDPPPTPGPSGPSRPPRPPHHHHTVARHVEQPGEGQVQGIHDRHDEPLERRLLAVRPSRRDLALAGLDHLEPRRLEQALERTGSELPQVVRRLAQHDGTPGDAVERQGETPRQRVRGQWSAQVEVPSRLQHARRLEQHGAAVGDVLEHVAHVNEIEDLAGQSRREQVALEHFEPQPAGARHGLGRELHTLRLPAALARVLEQPAAGAAQLEQPAGYPRFARVGPDPLERIEQAFVLGAEGRLRGVGLHAAAAAEVALEVAGRVERREPLPRGLDAQEAQPAAAALDEREGAAELVDERERPEARAAASRAALQPADGKRRGITHRAGVASAAAPGEPALPAADVERAIAAPPSTRSPS
jgi:hypothetical protein